MRHLEQVLTAAQMRAAEELLIGRGTSVAALMQRAGRGAADWVWRAAMGRPVTVLCGPGNNGGDGYVIAETLMERGLLVEVIAPLEPATQAARDARAQWHGDITDDAGTSSGGLFVDCLFGSGLSRALSSEHAALVNGLANRHDFTVAVDLPSGVATDDGALLGEVPGCELTLALGAWKPAHFLMPAMSRMGEMRLVDIGVEPFDGAATVLPRPRLQHPTRAAHKYSRGLVGVVGGTMPGAGLLAAKAAMHAGAGYVKLISSVQIAAAPASLVQVDVPLAEALSDRRWSALLVGPGLGRDEEARARLAAVLERGVPTALDADALHLLDDDLLEGMDRSRLLATPHEGEMSVLCETFSVEAHSKVERARSLAAVTGLTILAKGPDTVLASPDGRVAYFPPATSWLSVAGTGDVLAGIAAARMCASPDPFTAGGQAIYIHAVGAEMAGAAFTSDDLCANIASAYSAFL